MALQPIEVIPGLQNGPYAIKTVQLSQHHQTVVAGQIEFSQRMRQVAAFQTITFVLLTD